MSRQADLDMSDVLAIPYNRNVHKSSTFLRKPGFKSTKTEPQWISASCPDSLRTPIGAMFSLEYLAEDTQSWFLPTRDN